MVEVANLLLQRNFPASLHDDICAEVGLPRERLRSYQREARDPASVSES